MSVDEIIREAMLLPAAARARIATELQASLDLPGEELTEEEWDAVWAPELARRFGSVDDGTATLIPWRESVERIREHLKRKGQP